MSPIPEIDHHPNKWLRDTLRWFVAITLLLQVIHLWLDVIRFQSENKLWRSMAEGQVAILEGQKSNHQVISEMDATVKEIAISAKAQLDNFTAEGRKRVIENQRSVNLALAESAKQDTQFKILTTEVNSAFDLLAAKMESVTVNSKRATVAAVTATDAAQAAHRKLSQKILSPEDAAKVQRKAEVIDRKIELYNERHQAKPIPTPRAKFLGIF